MPPGADRVALALLPLLRGQFSGFEVDDFDHSLQAATRAQRSGADEQLIVAALCHDMGKAIDARHHDRIAARILAPYVRTEVSWVLGVHQDFSALGRRLGRRARLRHALHPAYGLACRFVDEWDLPSRDPAYESRPLEHFRPLLEGVLAVRRPPAPVAARVRSVVASRVPAPVRRLGSR